MVSKVRGARAACAEVPLRLLAIGALACAIGRSSSGHQSGAMQRQCEPVLSYPKASIVDFRVIPVLV